MIDRRRHRPDGRRRRVVVAAILCWLFGAHSAAWGGFLDDVDSGTTSLADAGQQGTFNVGLAQAALTRTFEPAVGGDVSWLEYTISSCLLYTSPSPRD